MAPKTVCQLSRLHTPAPWTIEAHHYVCVAWQLATPLVVPPPFPGPDQDGRGMLWDDRTVLLCPTHHRNTHYWIVRLMREVATLGKDDPQAAYDAIKPRRVPVELSVALTSLLRFAPYGSLLTLTQAGLWGQA